MKLSKQPWGHLQATLAHFWFSNNVGLVSPSHSSQSSTDPNPSSGKSLFLVWLLIRGLIPKLPTVLQPDPQEAVLFHEGDTSVFQNLMSLRHYLGLIFDKPSSNIWVLVDSDVNLLQPAPVFNQGRTFFVVEAASRRHRFKWAKKVTAEYFCMKTWDIFEVLQVYVTPFSGVNKAHYFCSRLFLGLSHGGPHGESKLRYLYDDYRATTRTLAKHASKPMKFENLVVAQAEEMSPNALRAALQNPNSDESSHYITRIEPSPTERSLSKKTIASPGAFVLIWILHLKNQVYDVAYFYGIFQQGGSVMASAAGWIFEFQMHVLLTQGYPITLFPLHLKSNRGKRFDVYDDYTDSPASCAVKPMLLVLMPSA